MKVNWDWVEDQLNKSSLPPEAGWKIKQLLETMEGVTAAPRVIDDMLDAFVKLSRGHCIEVQKPTERWGPVVPGAYSIGDTVRVRTDAYDGDRGAKHNGKRGRVTAARDGLVIMLYEDSPSIDIQYRHAPDKLQRLM